MYACEMSTHPEQRRRWVPIPGQRVDSTDADQNEHANRLIGQGPSNEAIERLPLDIAERQPSAAGVAKTLICIQNWLNLVDQRRSAETTRYDVAQLVKTNSKDSSSRNCSNASVTLNIGEATPPSRLDGTKAFAKRWASRVFYETVDFKETWYKVWLGVVTLTYLYNLVTIIARISFYELEEQLYVVWLVLNYISDAVYLFDTYVELRLIFLEHGMPVTDWHRVMKRNMKTKPFALSAVASLPTDHILGILPIGSSVVILSRFNRLIRFHRLVQFVNFAETETRMPNLFRTVQLMVIVYIIFHWATCFYFLVSLAYGLESDQWVYNSERILDVRFDCANSTCEQPVEVIGKGTCDIIGYPLLLKHYLLCLYWAALVLISVGEQPFPIEIGQYLFTIANIIAGTLILAALIGNVRIVIASMNQQRSTFLKCFDGVKNYMEMRKVNPTLRKRVISWFTYVWEQKHAMDEDSVMAMLPMNLRTQMAITLHIRTLRKANLFKDCDPGLLTEMALKLRVQIFSPNDYICRKGEIGKDMYIVKQGVLNVVAEDGVTVLVTLKEGSVFGELSILDIPGNRNGNRRTTSVRSVGFSELFVLSKSDLFESLEKYPTARRLLLEKGRQILRKDKLLIENEPLPKNVFDYVEQEYDYESLNQLSRNIVSLKRQLADKNLQVKRTCDLAEQRLLQLEQDCKSNYCTWRETC
uniref:Cyclic nucleotide-binding domain-containing protein n=1 Tax=Trichuris muris TaxID=70415 RepID=A0A5S6QWE9_TRIMR